MWMTRKLAIALAALVACAAAQTAYQPKYNGDPARSDSEAASIAYCKTVLNAERQYEKKYNKYSPTLLALAGGARSFTKRMARADRGDYTVHYRGGTEKFSLELTPKQFDAEHRAFYVDQTGVLRAEEDKPATADSPVLKDTK